MFFLTWECHVFRIAIIKPQHLLPVMLGCSQYDTSRLNGDFIAYADVLLIVDFRGACAVKGNDAVAGHVKRVDHDDVFDALLFREETLTRHYFILKFDCSWGIRTNMGKTEGIFLNLQCNRHIVGSIIIKLIDHRTISVGEARAIWDVGHYGKSLYLQNSESSNYICVFHYSSVICRLRRASNIYIL